MIKTILSIALLAACLTPVKAVTIVMDRGTTTGMMVINADGQTRVPIGSLIRWGTMNLSESPDNFVEFATTTIASVGTTGATATVAGSIRLDIAISGTTPTIINKQVYMWIYSSPTASASVNQGLFTSSAWIIPSNFGTDPSATFNLTLGQNVGLETPAAPAVSSIFLPSMLVRQATQTVGSVQNTPTGATNPAGYIYQLGTAIPETSTTLLGAVGALVLLRRRRR